MLDVLEFGDPTAAAGGGMLIVLLHGWGDTAEGIASLAPAIAPPGARVVVPQGPLPHGLGGRAWWDLDSADRPAWAWSTELPAGHRAHAGVLAARLAVLELIGGLRARHEPDAVAVVGFSQGAMLALDAGLQHRSGVDRVAALSGVLLADSVPALLRPPADPPLFLLAHGEADDQIPLRGGQTARDLLRRHGCAVEWLPVAAGHDVPDEVAAAVRAFLS